MSDGNRVVEWLLRVKDDTAAGIASAKARIAGTNMSGAAKEVATAETMAAKATAAHSAELEKQFAHLEKRNSILTWFGKETAVAIEQSEKFMRSVGKLMGFLGGIGAAAAAGWKAGTWLRETFSPIERIERQNARIAEINKAAEEDTQKSVEAQGKYFDELAAKHDKIAQSAERAASAQEALDKAIERMAVASGDTSKGGSAARNAAENAAAGIADQKETALQDLAEMNRALDEQRRKLVFEKDAQAPEKVAAIAINRLASMSWWQRQKSGTTGEMKDAILQEQKKAVEKQIALVSDLEKRQEDQVKKVGELVAREASIEVNEKARIAEQAAASDKSAHEKRLAYLNEEHDKLREMTPASQDRLGRAKDAAQQAWQWYRDPNKYRTDMAAQRDEQGAQKRFEGDAKQLQKREGWRDMSDTKLTEQEQIVRSVIKAREEQQAAQTALDSIVENTKVTATEISKLDKALRLKG